jgi:hypothetical protein
MAEFRRDRAKREPSTSSDYVSVVTDDDDKEEKLLTKITKYQIKADKADVYKRKVSRTKNKLLKVQNSKSSQSYPRTLRQTLQSRTPIQPPSDSPTEPSNTGFSSGSHHEEISSPTRLWLSKTPSSSVSPSRSLSPSPRVRGKGNMFFKGNNKTEQLLKNKGQGTPSFFGVPKPKQLDHSVKALLPATSASTPPLPPSAKSRPATQVNVFVKRRRWHSADTPSPKRRETAAHSHEVFDTNSCFDVPNPTPIRFYSAYWTKKPHRYCGGCSSFNYLTAHKCANENCKRWLKPSSWMNHD